MGGLSNFVGTLGGAGIGFAVGGPLGAAVGGAIGSGIDTAGAAGDAASTQAGAYQAGINEQARQFNVTQANLQPFLEAATGAQLPQGISAEQAQQFADLRAQGLSTQEISDQFSATGDPSTRLRGTFSPQAIEQSIRSVTQGPSALQQFQTGIEQAPDAPTLQQFGGQAVQAPTLQQFQGQAVQAPSLEQFQFDPRKALEDPALQFQIEQGQIQQDRAAGKNRLLGSGQRLIEAQKFGQGLASQSLQDQFNRQLAEQQARSQTAQAQFGLGSQQLGQEIGLTELERQRQAQQFGYDTQQLGQEQSLAQQEQNRLLTQYGLTSDQFNQRLNRLAGLVDVGAGTGGTLASAGQAAASNTANLLAAQGGAQAAGQIGQVQGVTGGLSQAAGLYALGGGFSPTGGTPSGYHYSSSYMDLY